jgi:cytochrome b
MKITNIDHPILRDELRVASWLMSHKHTDAGIIHTIIGKIIVNIVAKRLGFGIYEHPHPDE